MTLFLTFLLYILHAAHCLPLDSPLLDSYDYIGKPQPDHQADDKD
jgi:hypothetical protein